MPEKALFIGNDINNAAGGYSWSKLIDDLIQEFSPPGITIKKGTKPFPMLYEEIFLKSARVTGLKEKTLKSRIASNTKRLEANQIHEEILSLDISHIFTTNYDLTFQRLLGKGEVKNSGKVREFTYSLFRKYEYASHVFWHIHGIETLPRSITLGYEHYSGYLQRMRTYVVNGLTKTYKNSDFPSLIKRVRYNKVTHDSWIDFFFTHDIHIVGFNFSLVEMHLWWLLVFRERARVQAKMDIDNNIYYYYPEKYEKSSREKLDLFETNGVKTVALPDYRTKPLQYYRNVISEIGSS